jgi:hypothetical protein
LPTSAVVSFCSPTTAAAAASAAAAVVGDNGRDIFFFQLVSPLSQNEKRSDSLSLFLFFADNARGRGVTKFMRLASFFFPVNARHLVAASHATKKKKKRIAWPAGVSLDTRRLPTMRARTNVSRNQKPFVRLQKKNKVSRICVCVCVCGHGRGYRFADTFRVA